MVVTATVYIIGWNGDKWLPACLENLHRASAKRLHLVLIDNHNNPGIPNLPLDKFETRVVKTPRKMGFADAHNFGIVAAPPETDLVVLLNQDTKSADGWIDRCAGAFAEDPKLGVVMPGVRTYDDKGWDENFLNCAKKNPEMARYLEDEKNGRVEATDSSRCFHVPVVTAAAMVVRTEVLWEVGLFDPIFESYYEDYDFCRRASRAGWGIGICPAGRMYHYQGSVTDSPEACSRRERWVVRNQVIERVRETDGSRSAVLLKHFFLHFPRNLARGILRTPSSQSVRATLRANWDLVEAAATLMLASAG